MATLTYSYRSKKPVARLEIRLSFRIPGQNLHPKSGLEMPYSFYDRSRIEVYKEFWLDYKKGTKFKDASKLSIKHKIDSELHQATQYVLAELADTSLTIVDKKWLKSTMNRFYSSKKENGTDSIPKGIVDYFDYYLKSREHDSESLKKKYNTIKRKLIKFNPDLQIKDVGENFKNDFISWSKAEQYSKNTTQRDIRFIKTVIKNARIKGLEVNNEFELLRYDQEKTAKIYLNVDELENIKKVTDLPEYLKNARDWLLISCFTGQRISDFMRFDKGMLRSENGIRLLEFTQKKTQTNVSIPVLKQVDEILEERAGNFPRKISDQRYNEYIKKVCKKAGIIEKTKGKLSKNLSENKDTTKMRSISGYYSKWKLITSHIGRRSFATNYYGKIPTSFLINITGHSTEKQFLEYISKGQKDLALDSYKYFQDLN
ncbi:phage integrase SAM-like domain-containing protein [Sediminibacter sp. Hel_I_10]|uniref:phage integrase SAM-like domain-containing protein n=1 Tax=Sediminibacter sp. Hel_I_10 TaxID=1392490 RepID=UPI0006905F27|nr:phage integrase SAM-like domain-containing protein [Sediminibacter sp. Hel_I_10]